MPVFLCRSPNGDVSLAAGESEVEVADVLDEVDNPDAAELMQLDHAQTAHFDLHYYLASRIACDLPEFIHHVARQSD
jgi:hypothetical protein